LDDDIFKVAEGSEQAGDCVIDFEFYLHSARRKSLPQEPLSLNPKDVLCKRFDCAKSLLAKRSFVEQNAVLLTRVP
jgi:hypothetical protein